MKKILFCLYVAICTLPIGNILAADDAPVTPTDNVRAGRSVSDFLTPDGRFDLEALRASGYQGPLDLKEVDVRVDPRSGVPMARAASPQAPADDPDDIYWDNSISPSIPGVNGEIRSATVYDGKLIVVGMFTVAGGVMAKNIAAWDGTSWSALGSGVQAAVYYPGPYALTVYDGKLIAGGVFDSAGGVAANNIAAWDGTSWSALGSGMEGWSVYALTVFDGRLIAGGSFDSAGGVAANNIASWDGTSWSALGSGMDRGVYALTVYGGKLIAGGGFTTVGGVPANNIAAWDGSSWSALGSGMDDWVLALTAYDGRLIAGGEFDSAGGVAANNIASWDGTTWSALGSGMGRFVSALTVYDGKLIAGGGFESAGGVAAHNIAAWDGSSWSALGSWMGSVSEKVHALTVYEGKLIAGADIVGAGVNANYVAAWDGASWSALGSGTNGYVRALTVYDNKLIAGGRFTVAGDVEASNIAAWDGTAWSPLGLGIGGRDYTTSHPIVTDLTVYDGKLIAGGWFDSAGGVAASSIASWDGTSWSALGSGMNDGVAALTVYDGRLIAGGAGVAAWDGTSWSAVGSDWVSALTVYDGRLIAGGAGVAAWDGTSWSAVGSLMADWVSALTVHEGNLIAAANCRAFQSSWGEVHSWDGSGWSRIGFFHGPPDEYSSGSVSTLTVSAGKLIAGGGFAWVNWGDDYKIEANCIAAWDGTTWSRLGSGVGGIYRPFEPVLGVLTAIGFDHSLITGGWFTTAGGNASASLARWTKPACAYAVEPGHVSCQGCVDLSDVVLLGNFLDGLVDVSQLCLECAGDVDKDGDIDEDDYNLLYDMVAGVGP